jgi:hypothetical protein
MKTILSATLIKNCDIFYKSIPQKMKQFFINAAFLTESIKSK